MRPRSGRSRSDVKNSPRQKTDDRRAVPTWCFLIDTGTGKSSARTCALVFDHARGNQPRRFGLRNPVSPSQFPPKAWPPLEPPDGHEESTHGRMTVGLSAFRRSALRAVFIGHRTILNPPAESRRDVQPKNHGTMRRVLIPHTHRTTHRIPTRILRSPGVNNARRGRIIPSHIVNRPESRRSMLESVFIRDSTPGRIGP